MNLCEMYLFLINITGKPYMQTFNGDGFVEMCWSVCHYTQYIRVIISASLFYEALL